MPRIMKIFRSKQGDSFTSKPAKKSKLGGVFRKKVNSESKSDITSVPIEQAITWTLSDDSTSAPVNTEKNASPEQPSQVPPQPSPSECSVQSKFLFTEEDLIENEMNHIRALTSLESDINKLKKTTEDLVQNHASEMLKKDEDYVELLITVGEKEEELAQVRAELKATKEELAVVSCKLIQTQHQHFEDGLKSFWTSLFN